MLPSRRHFAQTGVATLAGLWAVTTIITTVAVFEHRFETLAVQLCVYGILILILALLAVWIVAMWLSIDKLYPKAETPPSS